MNCYGLWIIATKRMKNKKKKKKEEDSKNIDNAETPR